MINPENSRLLADERGALEAETALSRDEQKLWQRLEASQSDALDKRTTSLVARVGALENVPEASPAEVAKARQLALAGAQPDAVASGGERSAAVQARRAALQARELALKALQVAVGQAEAARVSRTRELEQAEQILAAVEKGAKAAAEAAQKAAADAARKAEEAARAEAARKAREAREKEAAARKAAQEELQTAPGLTPVSAPPRTESTAPPVKGGRPLVAAAPATTSGTMRKIVSRRRRVRLAPPPRKMEVEVATYGDNTFYTGFDQSIATGGLFIASLETLPEGHELELEIDLEGRKFSARGKVEFTREDNLANPECTQGAGLKLVNLPRDAQQSIEAFFEKRPPMFYMAV